MNTPLAYVLITLAWASSFLHAAEEKAILSVAPSLVELGPGWTTNLIACLLDPLSNPSEVDYFNDKPSRLLEFHREQMKKDGRTGYATIHYGQGNMVMNEGLYRVYIQRWADVRALRDRWFDWKMYPTRIARASRAIGIDSYWRDDGSFQEFCFRRGLFHVIVQGGSESAYSPMIRLAEVIDAKITGHSIPRPASGLGGSPPG
jgi:hypothetical protein